MKTVEPNKSGPVISIVRDCLLCRC